MRFSPYYIPVILGLAFTVPMATPASAQIGIGISINVPIAPPPIPVYVQPPIPEVGYLWTPGYWNYQEDGGYFWVPGTWVRPPRVGFLWTPSYWGFAGGAYGFHAGYWGATVGFYGGINYGFGYGGLGFEGGRWEGDHIAYNSTVNNFGGTHITNVYNKTVINNRPGGAAFNGGTGGVQAKATPEQEAAEHQEHLGRTPEQESHFKAAQEDKSLRASENHGKPAIAATAKPGDFKGPGVVQAKAAGPGADKSPAVMGAKGEAKEGPAKEGAEAKAKPDVHSPEFAKEHPKAAAGIAAREAREAKAKDNAAKPAEDKPMAEKPMGAPKPPRPAAHAPRPAGEPRPAPAPHPMAAPHPAPAPHPMAAPHPAPAPKPAPEKKEPK